MVSLVVCSLTEHVSHFYIWYVDF